MPLKSTNIKKAYSTAQKGEALAVVEACEGNVNAAARITGIPQRTLSDWVKKYPPAAPCKDERVLAAREIVKAQLADSYEDLARRCLKGITPKKIKDAGLRELVTASAIAVDKLRLLREEAPPPSAAEITAAESIKKCAEAMVKLARLAGVDMTREEAEEKIKEVQLASAKIQ